MGVLVTFAVLLPKEEALADFNTVREQQYFKGKQFTFNGISELRHFANKINYVFQLV